MQTQIVFFPNNISTHVSLFFFLLFVLLFWCISSFFFIPYSFSSSVKSASNVNESHPLMSWPCEKVGSQESLRFQESSVGIPPLLLLPLLPLACLPCRSTHSLAGFTYLQFALYCHWHSAVDQQGRGSSYLPGGSESCFLLAERS